VDTTHVVVQVPSPWESISWDGAVATFPQAEVGVISVSMQSVGFTFVAEQTGVGREAELGINAGGDLATVGLQVRIQILAVRRELLVGFRYQSFSFTGGLAGKRIFAWWVGGCRAFLQWQMGSSIFHHCGWTWNSIGALAGCETRHCPWTFGGLALSLAGWGRIPGRP
jgi:hypothetical protein